MNVIRLMGGLGNQLFQYALGRAQKENGITVRYENSSCLRNADRRFPRPYLLDRFQIQVQLAPFMKRKFIRQSIGFSMELLKMDNYNFDGYWQYLPFLVDILPVLRKEIVLKPEFYTEEFLQLKQDILSTESVSVHVRRGDYQTHKGVFRDLKFEYYHGAIKETTGDLFIFSDDIPWCKSVFSEKIFSRRIIFIDLPDYLSFELMKTCKTHIISNSTYSYWAALLSGNPTRCPQHWLGDAKIDMEELHYPKEWIKMEDYVVY